MKYRIRIRRNRRTPDRPFYLSGRLPVRQRVWFIGPIFVLVQPR